MPGMHADMHWMERTAEKRLNPDLVLPGARSMIMLGVSYWSEKIAVQPRRVRSQPRRHGRVTRCTKTITTR